MPALACLLLASPAWAATSGANATHDPSRLVESEGKFYFCSTGGGCASSRDGLAWTSAGALRIAIPSWSKTYMSGDQGVWAPDLISFGDKYFIYYSFCGVPAANAPCAIGLLTTPTLDASSTRFKLTDAGMVLNNPKNDATYQFSAIDPAPVVDATGNLWLVWGSGYGKDQSKTQLWITRMDNATGLPLTTDPAYKPPAVLGYPLKTGRREGAYMHYRDGNYYLFWNEGSCCSGTASTYTIWVSRSTSITGPFTGDKVFYTSTGNIHGPGHMGIYSACGVERFTYHYYPTATSILGENGLTWDGQGWPVVGAESTTPLVACGGTGGATGLRDAGAAGDAAVVGNDGASGAGGGGRTGNSERDGGLGGSTANVGSGTGGTSGGGEIDVGSGGAGTMGGMPSSGGDSATGGMVSAAGGSGWAGATLSRSGGTTVLPSAGAVSTGSSREPVSSSATTHGSAGTGTSATGNSGCSCGLADQPSHGFPFSLLLAAMSLTALRRTRSARASRP